MSEEEEGEEVENPPRATTPFPPSSSGATPKPTQSLLDAVAPMDAATPGVSTPIPAITHTSPEKEMEEGEEGEEGEAEEGETQEEQLSDVDLVDVSPERGGRKERALMEVEKAEEHEREEGEEGEEEGGDKMDVS